MSSYSAYWSQGNYQPQQQNQTFMSKTGPDYRTPQRSPNMGQQAVSGGASQYRTPGIADTYNSRAKKSGLAGLSGLDTLDTPQYNAAPQALQPYQIATPPQAIGTSDVGSGYAGIAQQPTFNLPPGVTLEQWLSMQNRLPGTGQQGQSKYPYAGLRGSGSIYTR